MNAILPHQISAEIEALAFIVFELERGPSSDELAERLHEIGNRLIDLSEQYYARSILLPPPEKV